MKVHILGCGNSVGVPVIGCDCKVCKSGDPKDKRTRSSVFIESGNAKILIDCGPDIRSQALSADLHALDAVFLTHAHFDHVTGVHELPTFLQGQASKDAMLPIYADSKTINCVKSSAEYLFASKKVGSAKWKRRYLELKEISYYKEFYLFGQEFFAFPQQHGNMICSGLIVDRRFAYCTDLGSMPDQMIEKMKSFNLDLLIVECFTYDYTPSHTSFDQALDYIQKINPKTAFFTHMTHKIGYQEVSNKIKSLKIKNIKPAYDGLYITI